MEELLDSAFDTQSLFLEMIDTIGIAYVDLDDERVKKALVKFLSGRIASESGIFKKAGFDFVSEYNNNFKKDKNKKYDIFESTDEIDGIDGKNPMLLKKMDDEFSKEALGKLDKVELLMRFAQMTNKVAKLYEEKADKLKKDNPKLYKIFEIDVYSELAKENFEACQIIEGDESTEDIYYIFLEYKNDEAAIREYLYDNDEYYDKYEKCIEKIKKELQTAFNKSENKSLKYEVNDEILEKYIEYRTYIKARQDAYSMKARTEQMCIYEVAKENIENPKSKKYIQYIADDIKNKDKGSDFQYVYCLAIDGYSDTFELHSSEELLKGAIEVIDNDIQNGTIVQNTNGLGGKVKNYTMPLIMEYPRFKTILPRRLPEEIVKNINNLYNHAAKVGGKLQDFMIQAMSITDFTEKNLKVYDNKRKFTCNGVYDGKKIGGE